MIRNRRRHKLCGRYVATSKLGEYKLLDHLNECPEIIKRLAKQNPEVMTVFEKRRITKGRFLKQAIDELRREINSNRIH